MLAPIGNFFKAKGQGLTEYVLILAFVAMIAFAMMNGETGLKSTISSTFSDSHSKIRDVSQ